MRSTLFSVRHGIAPRRFSWAGALLAALLLCASPRASAIDLTGGVMYAVPVPQGKAPVVDGDLKDFDLSREEPIYISPQTAHAMNAVVALNYDDGALYVAARISLPNRRLRNPYNPVDPFWGGDVLELRVAADPTLPAPLNNTVDSDRIGHITMWKNSETGRDYLNIAYGVNLDKGSAINPPGSSIVITEHGTTSYTLEAKIPWSALNVPEGRNPFAAGQRMTAIWSPHWGGEMLVAALYRQNPGTFAFNQPQTWGQVEFSAAGNLQPRGESMAQILARLDAKATEQPAAVGVPITVTVPSPMKVSINIFGPRGEVIRELAGGQARPAGKFTVRWDGKDQWGHPMPPANYRWGAYFHGGLKARFIAGVGKTAAPYYDTEDNRGGWGADHTNPLDVAADATGLYFLWPIAEAGRAIVKTDDKGDVVWRKTPFLGGGWGPFRALAADVRYVYLVRGDSKPQLSRLDAKTGQLQTWGENAPTEMPISDSEAIAVPNDSSPLSSSESFGQGTSDKQPESVGVAVHGGEVFAPVYSRNIIQVMDAASGKSVRVLALAGPRGVAVNARGDLYAVSYVAGQTPRVVKFSGAKGDAQNVVTGNLVAPWDVAVDETGRVFVSDGGASQQIKVFATGALRGARKWTMGKPGGRTWAGTYDPTSFLNPAGIAIDARGGLLVAESSIPKVMSRFNARGQLVKRWFGAPQYWNGTWPDTDPRVVYYQLSGGFGRANLARPDYPQAYWALPKAGYPEVGNYSDLDSGIIPMIVVAKNGRKYLVGDLNPNGICLVQGDAMLPVAHFKVINQGDSSPVNALEVWQDANGDHQRQQSEVTRVEKIGGQPLPRFATYGAHSSFMAANGDFYIITAGNKILMFPCAGFNRDGSLRWNIGGARYAVPAVLPAQGDSSYVGARGQVGVRTDSRGNIYTALSVRAPALTPELEARMKSKFPGVPETHWGAFETQAMADVFEGLGHAAESNAAKFIKYDAQGRIVWMAGRKATAAARPGEIYHFWALAGLIGDDYVAGASEWGPITLYTKDGFFVDTLMNNPGLNPPPGPYTFGSETGAGRVQYFPKQDQVWAYSVGMAYIVDGFKKGKVIGEQRSYGTVALDRVYDTATVQTQIAPLQIARLGGDPLQTPALWNDVASSNLSLNDARLATAQLAYDDANFYGRIHIVDETPGQNSADSIETAFKGGDTAGVVLGPVSASTRTQATSGDIRLMVANINGQTRLIAMKMVTSQTKRPFEYFTPSSGRVSFEFVGEVPGGLAALTPDADRKGYTATFAVPRSFLEFDLKPGTQLSGDVEVRLGGAGPRGLQTTSRNYLFTPRRSETTMTDDTPTESRLYPGYFGAVEVQ